MPKTVDTRGTARRSESMQQSSATPKNQDVGIMLQKWLHAPHSSSHAQCLLVSSFWHGVIPTSFLTLGAHAQEGYGTCLSVCLSVTTLAATSFVLTLKVRYVGVYYRLFLDFR